MRNTNQKTLDRLAGKIEAWLSLAEPRHVAEGKAWYDNARAFCREVSHKTGVRSVIVAGVVAALSPAVRWENNKRQAEALCQAYVDTGDLYSIILTTYGKQADKARAILELGPDASLATIEGILGRRAFKTVAFFQNIVRSEIPHHRAVTIDRHILKALSFEDSWTQGAAGCYLIVEEAFCQVASRHSLGVYQLQAIIWLTYKDFRLADLPV